MKLPSGCSLPFFAILLICITTLGLNTAVAGSANLFEVCRKLTSAPEDAERKYPIVPHYKIQWNLAERACSTALSEASGSILLKFSLARVYALDRPAAAEKLLRENLAEGHAPSMYMLANLLFAKGIGGTQSTGAIRLLRLGVEAGHIESILQLGQVYLPSTDLTAWTVSPNTIKQNYSEGIKLIEQAEKLGSEEASISLALLMSNSKIGNLSTKLKHDPLVAMNILRRLSKKGSINATSYFNYLRIIRGGDEDQLGRMRLLELAKNGHYQSFRFLVKLYGSLGHRSGISPQSIEQLVCQHQEQLIFDQRFDISAKEKGEMLRECG